MFFVLITGAVASFTILVIEIIIHKLKKNANKIKVHAIKIQQEEELASEMLE